MAWINYFSSCESLFDNLTDIRISLVIFSFHNKFKYLELSCNADLDFEIVLEGKTSL